MIEIRWHGRGGQGTVTAAKIVANAAFRSGYRGVVMTPTIGTERRGVPVFTSLKISKNKIYDLSPIEKPDMLVVLDHVLLEENGVVNGLKPGGLIVINTPKPPDAYDFPGMKVAVADVTSLASQTGLKPGIVNSGIIGAFARAGDLLTIETLVDAIKEEFKDMRPNENVKAAKLVYEKTVIGVRPGKK
ncbi:MAG: ketoisovalerate oxidoreductase [Deltaproteobacteria bacterium RBG_16_54_11]|nr:MAG: ketoisovalerate oxidoreductase [Deltaproteobacteria bacterium RBG_16_54_11]